MTTTTRPQIGIGDALKATDAGISKDIDEALQRAAEAEAHDAGMIRATEAALLDAWFRVMNANGATVLTLGDIDHVRDLQRIAASIGAARKDRTK